MKQYIYDVDIGAEDAPAKVLRAVGHGKRVLEVGCASGVQSRILKEHYGCAVTGIEINPDAAAKAAPYCERIVIGDLESMNFKVALGDERFDVITIADVLEHLREPREVLAKLKQFLTPVGFVVASIPNIVHAGLVLQMAHGRFDYRPYGLLDDTHIRFFTIKGVIRLFEQAGMGILGIDRVVRPIEATEFAMHPLSPDETSVLEFIRQNNPEFQTYQFIITANAIPDGMELRTYGQIDAEERLKDAELVTASLKRRVSRLESQISWIQSRMPYRLMAAFRRWLRP